MRHNSSIFISFLLCGFHLILNLKTNDSYSFRVQEGWEEWVGVSVGENLKGMCEVLGLIPCKYMYIHEGKGKGRTCQTIICCSIETNTLSHKTEKEEIGQPGMVPYACNLRHRQYKCSLIRLYSDYL